MDPIPTVGSKMKAPNHVEVVTYRKPQKKVVDGNRPKRDLQDQNTNEFKIKEARREVIKLGTSGFFKYKREKTMTALAIELGAKPDKKKFKNYKDLQQLRKQQRQKREEKLNMLKESSNLSSLNHYKKKYAQKKEQKSTRRIDILNSYGKVKRK